MTQATAAANTNEQPRKGRLVASFKQGGLEVSVWENRGQNGDFYNTTISNSYKDESGDWKPTTSYSPTDLAVLTQLSSQAFHKIVHEKAQSRTR